MAQRKESRQKVVADQAVNGKTLHAAVEWVVDRGIFDDLRLHGNTGWSPVNLVVLATLWVWSERRSLTDAFDDAHHWCLKVLNHVALDSYQGLMGALVTWTDELLPRLWRRMHQLARRHGKTHYDVGPWMALAVDGSRVTVPRSKANEKAFCAPNYGKSRMAKYRRKKTRGMRLRQREKQQPVKPQIWLTLVWHMGMRIPWSWKSGPSYSSERDHFRQMLAEQDFPENTLFCADAGFTGYDLWKAITDRQYSFLIRVGGNVSLLRRLRYYTRERQGILYCWPQEAARKKQPPLVLRIIRIRLGRRTACLLTNVLNQHRLSDKLALQLYKMRWGVELQFRTLKQTFRRRNLRCRRPDRAMVELDWSLVGLTMIQLFAVKEQIKLGRPPEQCSVAAAINIVRDTMYRWDEHPEIALELQLQQAVKDDYQRQTSKKARYRPNYKEKPSAGKPKIVTATRRHKNKLARYLAAAA